MAAFAVPLISSGLSAITGLLGGSKPKQTTTDSNFTQSDTPNLSPLQQSLSNAFGAGALSRFQKGTDLSGYTAGGLRTINQGADVANQATKNILASRGLSYSPAAATSEIQNQNARLGQSSDFLNSIPMLQRQLQGQDLDALIKSFSALPTARTATGTSHQVSTTPVPGGALGGFLNGLGQGLTGPYTNDDGSITNNLQRLFGGGQKKINPGVQGLTPDTWASIFGGGE